MDYYYPSPSTSYLQPSFPQSMPMDDEPDWHGVAMLNLESSDGTSPDDFVELYLSASQLRPDLNFQNWPRRLQLKVGNLSLFRKDDWNQDGIAAFVPDDFADTDPNMNARNLGIITSVIDEYETVAYCSLNGPGACRGAGIVFVPSRDLRRFIGYIFWKQPVPFIHQQQRLPPRPWHPKVQDRQRTKRVTFAVPRAMGPRARADPHEQTAGRRGFLHRVLGNSRWR